MSTSARVDSIDAIKDFRVYLTKFQEMATIALGDADSEMQRIQSWLEGEQQTYWSGQIRKRQEILSRAEEAYRQKKLYKDATGSSPSAVEEQKALMIAKKNLADAQAKLNNVKQWNRKLQKEIVLYRGGVAAFSNAVSAGVPSAIAQLAGIVEMLEKYVGLAPAAAGEMGGEAESVAGTGAEAARGSMSRAPDEMPALEEVRPIDLAALREALPKDEVLGDPVLLAMVNLICGFVTPEQRSRAAELPMGEPPGDGETIILSAMSAWAERVFLVRKAAGGNYAWFIGAVDAAPDTVYNKVTVEQLRAARPDFAELLKLPVDSLMVLDGNGLAGIYNSSNENTLPPPLDETKKAAGG